MPMSETPTPALAGRASPVGGQPDHRLGDVDPDDLAGRSEIIGERERRIAGPS